MGFVECYDEDEYYIDGNCWMEHCGNHDDPCGRYSCTMWYYDERADYWDYYECPEEETDFFEDFGAFVTPFFDIAADTIAEEIPNYCPNEECQQHYADQATAIAQDTIEDVVAVEDVEWEIDNFLADDEGVDAAKETVQQIEDVLNQGGVDIDLDHIQDLLDSENHDEVFEQLSGLVNVFTEGWLNE